MDDVSPVVKSLWRLIRLLEAEEKEWNKREGRRTGMHSSNNKRVCDGINKQADDRTTDENRNDTMKDTPCLIDENNSIGHNYQTNRFQDENVHNSKAEMSSFTRDTIPSDCVSPITNFASTSDILHSDKKGWLIDQLRGRRVWCAVSNKMFCVFENENSQVSKQALLLPRCHVRQLEFKSADQEGAVINGVSRHCKSKSASSIDKFQFILENPMSGQKYMFGAASSCELGLWMEALSTACSLKPHSNLPHRKQLDAPSSQQVGLQSEIRQTVSEKRTRQNSIDNSFSELSNLSLSAEKQLSDLPTTDASSRAAEGLRRLRKKQNGTKSNPVPMKVKYEVKESSHTESTLITHEHRIPKSRMLLKIKSPLDGLFRRRKRYNTTDVIPSRSQFFTSDPNNTSQLPNNSNVLTHNVHSDMSLTSQEPSSTESENSQGNDTRTSPSLSVSSCGTQKKSRGRSTSFSLKRVASDFKSKLFRRSSLSDNIVPSSTGIILKNLNDFRISGCLQYRRASEFTKMHCVVSRGCFYAFRTDNKDQCSELAVALNQCTVAYIADAEERIKSIFAFKVTQPKYRSIFLCADDHQTLMKWLMALQFESCKIMADENLAAEMGETKLSLKTKQARDKTASKATISQVDNSTMKTKWPSCPNIDDIENNLPFPGNFGSVLKQDDIKSWKNPNVRNKNTVIGTIRDFNIYENKDIYNVKYSSLQSLNLKTTDMVDIHPNTQVLSALTGNVLMHTSPIGRQGCRNFSSETERSRDAFECSEKMGSMNLQVSHEHTQSTHSVTMPVVNEQLLLEPEPRLNFSASVGKEEHNQRCIHDVNMAVSNMSSHAIDVVIATERDTHLCIQKDHHELFPSDSSPANEQTLSEHEPMGRMLDIRSCQSDVDSVQEQYNFDSPIHDDVLKQTWSTKKDFLLEVVKQKLRTRQIRGVLEADIIRDKEDVCIVNDHWNGTEAKQVRPQYKHKMASRVDGFNY